MKVPRATRRNPEMEKYVEVSQYAKTEPWRVRLKAGVQSFEIGNGHDSKEEAEWMRDMLCIALATIKKEK